MGSVKCEGFSYSAEWLPERSGTDWIQSDDEVGRISRSYSLLPGCLTGPLFCKDKPDFFTGMVSMLASGTQDRGFDLGRSRWIFRAKKSTACLPWGGRFARHVKGPWVYVEVEITGKIDRPFLARNSVFRLIEVSHVACTWRHLQAKVGTSKGGGKQWQPTPKKLPRMQCARAIPAFGLNTNDDDDVIP